MSNVNFILSSESFVACLHRYNVVSCKYIKGSRAEVQIN
jgi:hypothetical protein